MGQDPDTPSFIYFIAYSMPHHRILYGSSLSTSSHILCPVIAYCMVDETGSLERCFWVVAARVVWGHNTWSGIAYCMANFRLLQRHRRCIVYRPTSRHAVPRRIVYGHDRALYGQGRIIHGHHRILYGQHRILYGMAPQSR